MSHEPPAQPSFDRKVSLEDPKLLPYLPLLYVAWADGDLTEDEMQGVCGELDFECRSLLSDWLDPRRPPSADELRAMLSRIRAHARYMESGDKLDLAGLGLRLAQSRDDGTVAEAERAALARLEDALGIASTEAARQLLTTRRVARHEPAPEPAFSVADMSTWLAGDYGEVRRRVFELLEDPSFQYVYDLPKEKYREVVLDWCRQVASAGIGSLSFPKEHGGAGDIGQFIAAFEALSFFDLSLVVKTGVQFGLFGGSILNLGTERHHREYLPRVGSLELPGCFAMTETGHGSNVADLETFARFDPETDEFVVHTPQEGARKDYIGNAAAHARLATVFAQLEIADADGQWVSQGVHAFLVPIRHDDGTPCEGVWIGDCGHKMGLNGVDNGRLKFDQVRIPRANLLDRFAGVDADGVYSSPIASPTKRFFTMLGTLVGGRVSVALGALSVAKSALTIAIHYGDSRRQFGPMDRPETLLLDYRTHQRRLLPRLAATFGLHFALYDLRRQFVASDPLDRRAVEAEAAGLKALSTWHTIDTVQTCRECCGGQGYLSINRFADLKADSDVFATFEGDNVVLLQLLAKSMLGDYKRQFGHMTPLGLVRYVAERAAIGVAELNPVVVRLASREHLLDREFHRSAFAWRERRLLSSVARRLKSRLDNGMEAADALVACQDHLVTAARAHVENRILTSFADALDRQGDPPEKRVLSQVCDLYALSRLEEDRGFFLEQGYFEAVKAKAIRKLVLDLCSELRPQASALVNAFGIPERLLGAPIAR